MFRTEYGSVFIETLQCFLWKITDFTLRVVRKKGRLFLPSKFPSHVANVKNFL